jgi:hypothetical protein
VGAVAPVGAMSTVRRRVKPLVGRRSQRQGGEAVPPPFSHAGPKIRLRAAGPRGIFVRGGAGHLQGPTGGATYLRRHRVAVGSQV